MPDVISDTNGKLCVGSYHMWRLLSSPDNYSLFHVMEPAAGVISVGLGFSEASCLNKTGEISVPSIIPRPES